MKMRVGLIANILAILLTPLSLPAQETPVPKKLVGVKRVLREGERVRLVYQVSGEDGLAMAEGTLLSNHTQALLTIETAETDTLSVPLAGLRGLDVQSGTRRSTLQGSIVGALVGGVLAYGIGSWAYDSFGCAVGGPGCPGVTASQMVIGWESEKSCSGRPEGALVGAVLGGVIGAAIGRGIERKTWERVPLEYIDVTVASWIADIKAIPSIVRRHDESLTISPMVGLKGQVGARFQVRW